MLRDLYEQQVKQPYLSILSDRKSLQTLIRESEQSLFDVEETHKQTVQWLEDANGAIIALQRAISIMSERGLVALQTMLTDTLQTIFPDRDYKIEVVVDDRGKDKKSELYLIETKDGVVVRTELKRMAGALRAIIALILRVFLILAKRSRRVICMDEALSDLPTEYIEGLMQFLQYLHAELGFDVLSVFHDIRFVEYIGTVVHMEDGRIVGKSE